MRIIPFLIRIIEGNIIDKDNTCFFIRVIKNDITNKDNAYFPNKDVKKPIYNSIIYPDNMFYPGVEIRC